MTNAEWMAAARKRQGLPPTIEDQAVLARLSALVAQGHTSDGPGWRHVPGSSSNN